MNLRNTLAVARTIRVPPRVSEPTARGLFIAAYHQIATACRPVERPGMAVFAVADSGDVVGVRLVIEPREVVPLVVGRHEYCDLVIDQPAVALRQLVLVVEPGLPPVCRVIDLRPDGDLADETGRGTRSLRTDGVAVLRSAAFTLFVLPLGDPSQWPVRAEQAWAMLPQRVYLEERGTTPPPRHLLTSVAFRVRGPRFSLEHLEHDDRVGTVELSQQHGSIALAVGMRALADGIVIGRSASRERLQVTDSTLSRSHALIIKAGPEVVAIDLASTFGMGLPMSLPSRVCVLGAECELWLGHSTRMRWRASVIP